MEALIEKLILLLSANTNGTTLIALIVILMIWLEIRAWKRELIQVKLKLSKLIKLHTEKYPKHSPFLYGDNLVEEPTEDKKE